MEHGAVLGEARLRRFLAISAAALVAFPESAMTQTAASSTGCGDASGGGFWALGAIFGYFLSYSIRSGSKTQDVFKSFLGAIGAGGGAATTALVAEACRFPMLASYAGGTAVGFGAFAVLSLILALIYSRTFDPEKVPTRNALLAETLGKVLLGEDFRPPAVRR